MLHIVLFQPQIPPNTGNIIRLCANTGAQLHLIHPLGFTWDDKRLQRAGLDYHEFANIQHHENFDDYMNTAKPKRIIACETSGTVIYSDFQFADNDHIMFGAETHGITDNVLQHIPEAQQIVIPMQANNRSINLSNSVAIVLFDAWRQLQFTM